MSRAALSLVPFLLVACATESAEKDVETSDDTHTPLDTADVESGGELVGSCLYTNPFASSAECKEYTGAGWTDSDAQGDCAAPMVGADPGSFQAGIACDRSAILGECFIDQDADNATILVFPGTDPDSCSGVALGCDFASGTFEPADVCEGTDGGGGTTGGDVFRPFEQVCVDPIEGEPPGAGPDGQVCTWEAISGSTEAGRRYVDYASCEPIFTQRPYWAVDVEWETAEDDPRLTDPAFQEELAWVTSQVESSACVCCHSENFAPDGPSMWYLEAGPIWTDSVTPEGMAVMAGWIDSTAFGAFDPADNNGFDRNVTGIGTTDNARMQAFWTGELARQGYSEADFAATEPFGGPLYDQIVYELQACENGEGVTSDGRVVWTGGDARYVYVLAPGSLNPGVPPNLDLPDGTLWRLDVAWTADPISSGILYGEEAAGSFQAFPATGAPEALVPGQQYAIYVLRDIYQPVTRCLFTAE
jgi:hypothetical protein